MKDTFIKLLKLWDKALPYIAGVAMTVIAIQLYRLGWRGLYYGGLAFAWGFIITSNIYMKQISFHKMMGAELLEANHQNMKMLSKLMNDLKEAGADVDLKVMTPDNRDELKDMLKGNKDDKETVN